MILSGPDILNGFTMETAVSEPYDAENKLFDIEKTPITNNTIILYH
jgi:hypothetical protein